MRFETLLPYARDALEKCKSRGWKVATAESCTGGLIAALLSDVPGASKMFECGFITYSNEAKTNMLGVDVALIEKHGAVSEQVAEAMAKGAVRLSNADIAIGVTGIAGPTGGTPDKPVGLVYIAVAVKDKVKVEKHNFPGSRDAVRDASARRALELLNLSCV